MWHSDPQRDYGMRGHDDAAGGGLSLFLADVANIFVLLLKKKCFAFISTFNPQPGSNNCAIQKGFVPAVLCRRLKKYYRLQMSVRWRVSQVRAWAVLTADLRTFLQWGAARVSEQSAFVLAHFSANFTSGGVYKQPKFKKKEKKSKLW